MGKRIARVVRRVGGRYRQYSLTVSKAVQEIDHVLDKQVCDVWSIFGLKYRRLLLYWSVACQSLTGCMICHWR